MTTNALSVLNSWENRLMVGFWIVVYALMITPLLIVPLLLVRFRQRAAPTRVTQVDTTDLRPVDPCRAAESITVCLTDEHIEKGTYTSAISFNAPSGHSSRQFAMRSKVNRHSTKKRLMQLRVRQRASVIGPLTKVGVACITDVDALKREVGELRKEMTRLRLARPLFMPA